jgi:hypothetical protein
MVEQSMKSLDDSEGGLGSAEARISSKTPLT